ncbi:MAG: hypothetical protein ACI4PM_00590 [Butyricicoccus sp.]
MMLTQARELLEALGLPNAEDDPLLMLAYDSVSEQIRNQTNQPDVPEDLQQLAAEMIAGQYMRMKKAAGQLKMESVDLSAAVKEIKEGDTTVSFAVGEGSQTSEQRLDALIARLTADRTRELYRHRRLEW